MFDREKFNNERIRLQKYFSSKRFTLPEIHHGVLTFLTDSLGVNRASYWAVRHLNLNLFECTVAKGGMDPVDHYNNLSHLTNKSFTELLEAYEENDHTTYNQSMVNKTIPLCMEPCGENDSVLSQAYREEGGILVDPLQDPSILELENNKALFDLLGYAPTYFLPLVKNRTFGIIALNRAFEDDKSLDDIIEPINQERYTISGWLEYGHLAMRFLEQKEISLAEAQAASKARDDQWNIVTHRSRQLITTIGGYARRCKKLAEESNIKLNKYLDVITEDSKALEIQHALLNEARVIVNGTIEPKRIDDILHEIEQSLGESYKLEASSTGEIAYTLMNPKIIGPIVQSIKYFLRGNGTQPVKVDVSSTKYNGRKYLQARFKLTGHPVDDEAINKLKCGGLTGKEDGSKEYILAKNCLQSYDGDIELGNERKDGFLKVLLPVKSMNY